ncbi:MAG: hypothetical protein ACQ9IQ_08240 [Nitrospirales bacterium]
MNIGLGCQAKALDEGHEIGLCLGVCQSGTFDQKGRDGAVEDLQQRRKQGHWCK